LGRGELVDRDTVGQVSAVHCHQVVWNCECQVSQLEALPQPPR
jgi:hypothetical protein